MGTAFIVTLFVFGAAVWVAWRLRSNSIQTTGTMLLGVLLTFLAVRWLLAVQAPNQFMATNRYVSTYWSPVLNEFGLGSAQSVSGVGPLDTLGSLVGGVVVPVAPVTSIQPTVGAPAASQLAITSQDTGGNIGQVTQIDPTVLAEQERQRQLQAQLIGYYNQLAQYKAAGDVASGELIIGYIESLNPGDTTAAREKIAISQARQRVVAYRALGSNAPNSLSRDAAYQLAVNQALSGGYYLTLGDGATLSGWSCKSEWATVQDISEGWSRGASFRVLRCYLDNFGGSDTGAQFLVP